MGTVLLAGCSDGNDSLGPSETTEGTISVGTPKAEQYENVIDIVEAGADPTGSDPIDPVLEEAAANDTLLQFPEGAYFLERWNFKDYSNLALVGDGATLVPPSGLQDYWLFGTNLRNFRFEGFGYDNSADKTAPITLFFVTGGTNVVRDVAIDGFREAGEKDHGFEFSVQKADATLLVENVRMPDGSSGGSAVYVHPESPGTLSFRDCHIEDWYEGLYASAHSGPLSVIGGTYANSGIQQIRVGGSTHGATIRDATVRVDGPSHPEQKENLRGIWLKEGANGVVENCDIRMTDLAGRSASAAIVIETQYGNAIIRDTHIRTDEPVNAIRIREPVEEYDPEQMPGMDGLPDDWTPTVQNVTITGDAEQNRAIRVHGRSNALFQNVVLEQEQGDRQGMYIDSDSNNCTISGGTWTTAKYPLIVEASRADVESTHCPITLKGVSRFAAVNHDDAEEIIADGDDGQFCIRPTENGIESLEIVILVTAIRDGHVYGRTVSVDTYDEYS